jgi:hypothetical protein
LEASEVACEQFCRDHPDEARAILEGKTSPEAAANWAARYWAAEADAYNRALTEARTAELNRAP